MLHCAALLGAQTRYLVLVKLFAEAVKAIRNLYLHLKILTEGLGPLVERVISCRAENT